MTVRGAGLMGAVALTLALVSTVRAAQPTTRPSDEERGEELYRRHCVQCHGVRNAGDGPATRALVATVPDLRGKLNQQEATLNLIMRGRGSMPGYEASFDKPDARRVVRYMMRLGDEYALPPEATPAAPRPPRGGRVLVPSAPVDEPADEGDGDGAEGGDE